MHYAAEMQLQLMRMMKATMPPEQQAALEIATQEIRDLQARQGTLGIAAVLMVAAEIAAAE